MACARIAIISTPSPLGFHAATRNVVRHRRLHFCDLGQFFAVREHREELLRGLVGRQRWSGGVSFVGAGRHAGNGSHSDTACNEETTAISGSGGGELPCMPGSPARGRCEAGEHGVLRWCAGRGRQRGKLECLLQTIPLVDGERAAFGFASRESMPSKPCGGVCGTCNSTIDAAGNDAQAHGSIHLSMGNPKKASASRIDSGTVAPRIGAVIVLRINTNTRVALASAVLRRRALRYASFPCIAPARATL